MSKPQIPLSQIDKEIKGLIKALNAASLITCDSCFGHPNCFNHFFFIGFKDINTFKTFASFALADTYGSMGKVYLIDPFLTPPNEPFGFSLSFSFDLRPKKAYVIIDSSFTRLQLRPTKLHDFMKTKLATCPCLYVRPFHDPSSKKGIQEKLHAVKFLTKKAALFAKSKYAIL
jgi:hypothetical protein